MTEKEIFRSELERLKNELIKNGEDTMFEQGRISAFEDAILVLDNIKENVVKQPVSEAISKVEEKAKNFTEAHKDEGSEEILAGMRGEEFSKKLSNIERIGKNWKENSVNDELETEIHNKIMTLHTAPCYDELADFARYFVDYGKKQQKTVADNLEEEIVRYIGYPQEVDEDISTTMIRKAARHFANWQKSQMLKKGGMIQQAYKPEIHEAHRLGREEGFYLGKWIMREQIMKDAVDGLVCGHKEDCPAWIELSFTDKPDVNVGDNIKIYIIKENNNGKD